MPRLTDKELLVELEPTAEKLLNRHEKLAQEWFPHEYIPWSEGRNYPKFFEDGEPWTPDQPRLTGVAQIAFEVNLLTEDNLPSYHREIYDMFGAGDGAWINWTHRWTAEEARHSIVLRDYLTVTRNIDPVLLEQQRMDAMETGYNKDDKDALRGIAYVSFQELATRISHRNTGRYSEDPVADRIMARISADENLHMVFYRDIMKAALEIDPSRVVDAVTHEVMNFQMPGAGLTNFQRKAVQIAKAGIYNLRVHHDDVVWPLLRYWGIFELEGLDDEAEKSRQRLAEFLTQLDAQAIRFEEKRARLLAREAERRE